NRIAAIDLAREALSAAADDPGVLGRAAMVAWAFRRGYRCGPRLDRSRSRTQSELCLWLVLERLVTPIRRSGGAGDPAFRDLDASQSSRSTRLPFGRRGNGAFCQSSVRGSVGGAAGLA